MDAAVTGTLASRIHQQLRHDIVRGRLKAAAKLKLAELQQRYGIGLAPLREALARLCGEQLVVSADQRGFWVAPLSLQELDDIAKVRVLVVDEAMNDSILHGDAAWEAQVVQALDALAAIERDLSGSTTQPPGDVLDELEARNFAFHRALLGACRSPWLLRLQDMFYHQAERYRYAALPRARDKRFSLDEHMAIADAALARNVIKACRLHDEHMARTHASVRAALARHLQPDAPAPQARASR
ncbi:MULTISPECIES: GntR family transcriptional regulator [Pseudoxanthomonas]|uniref:GntR family carbon starvation induced transcriptional regulator n=1 Tax=Pseudoxanthomonas winnipegensis TaxID=2480810 RepID=A0AAW8G791_9GAMM|nr:MULTISPECIES: GntR family transcriptional regulator [Pseudoxanthomonas]MDQ1118191.1 GntR family carbon starvation induced transcriptional regulator [Pseudoxanthomonas winnipegensis]MDQ1135164.1 GntR family carbon starvation induced transcriptional regulator [Pseudoxanthomonas winnipegensis]MDR6138608.1 GntR family carbon starvation induced transcriptional regulator [Pseudoxanthomonas sp. SORGH_AS_0997]TAA41215.1 FCD domain-containing protein [Pseudoxanthomonas winnipegensis]